MHMKNNLSKKLKKLRIKSGLTQEKKKKKIKVSPSCIGMYEQGRREPKSHVLSQICKELDATGDYILDLEKNVNKPLDVCDIIEEFTKFIETEENIMLNGMPIKTEDKRKISNALKIATAVALADTKKNEK